MRPLRLLLAAALLAGSIPADAQVRALRHVGGGNAAAPVRLSVPSAGVVPSLAMPSLAPSLAPSLPALNDAPKPGEAFRAEAAETIAQWRAARAAAPAPLVAPEASAPKAALSAEQTAAAATDAIIAAKGVDEALGSLVSLGVLKAEALPEGPTDRLALLKRVWDGVSGKRAAELLPVDAGWAVPALKVERGGKTYLVHGVAHGEYYPAHRGVVMRLVKQVSAQGGTLLSEQRIPEHYGFSYGLETLDHAVIAHDERAEVVKAARGLPPAAIGAVHALMRLAALGGVGYAWARAALQGADPLAWGIALAGGAALYLLWRGMQPLNRLSVLAGAREADSLGSPHLAEQLRREAKAFFTKPVKAEDVRALHLPPGPAAASDEFSPRSAAIAAAAQAAEGAVVHVLVGYKHAAEIAWRLAGYPAGGGAASKKEDAANGGRINRLSGIAIAAMVLGGALILGGSYLGVGLATGAGAALLAATVLAWAMPRHFSRVPFGSYRTGYWQGRPARYYGWSLSPNTFFQSAVLGALGGPIVFGLMGGSLLWSIGGMALAPLVVDLLKPTILFDSTPGGRNGGAVAAVLYGGAVLALAAAGAGLTTFVARILDDEQRTRALRGPVDGNVVGSLGFIAGFGLALLLPAYWPVAAALGLAVLARLGARLHSTGHRVALAALGAAATGMLGAALFAGLTASLFAWPALLAAILVYAAMFHHNALVPAEARSSYDGSEGPMVGMIVGLLGLLAMNIWYPLGALMTGLGALVMVQQMASNVLAGSRFQRAHEEARRNGGAVESLASRIVSLAGSKPKLPRDLTMTEVFVLNLAGMAASVGIGMLLKSWLVGLIGLYLMPVPFIVGYVLARRLMGDAVKMPLIRYDPGISWAGKRYPYGDDDKGARNGGRISQVGFFAALGLVSLLLGLGLQDGWFLLGGGIWLGTALLGLLSNRRR